MPSTVMNVLWASSHVIFTRNLWSRCYHYPHFTHGKWRNGDLGKLHEEPGSWASDLFNCTALDLTLCCRHLEILFNKGSSFSFCTDQGESHYITSLGWMILPVATQVVDISYGTEGPLSSAICYTAVSYDWRTECEGEEIGF